MFLPTKLDDQVTQQWNMSAETSNLSKNDYIVKMDSNNWHFDLISSIKFQSLKSINKMLCFSNVNKITFKVSFVCPTRMKFNSKLNQSGHKEGLLIFTRAHF